jgi:hypothetical protein
VPGGGCAASSGQRRNDLATQRIVPGRGGNAGIRCAAVVRRPESGWAAPEPSVRLLPCFVSCMGCCVSYLLIFLFVGFSCSVSGLFSLCFTGWYARPKFLFTWLIVVLPTRCCVGICFLFFLFAA